MQITARHSYSASPGQILVMMADERWLAEIARRAGAQEWDVSVDTQGSHVWAAMPAPARAQRFTGPTMKVGLTIAWSPLTDVGISDGSLDVSTPGMPASMTGTAHLAPEGAASIVTYLANFAITVPLIGKSLEQAAAPYVRRIIDIQQSVGTDYLAENL